MRADFYPGVRACTCLAPCLLVAFFCGRGAWVAFIAQKFGRATTGLATNTGQGPIPAPVGTGELLSFGSRFHVTFAVDSYGPEGALSFRCRFHFSFAFDSHGLDRALSFGSRVHFAFAVEADLTADGLLSSKVVAIPFYFE